MTRFVCVPALPHIAGIAEQTTTLTVATAAIAATVSLGTGSLTVSVQSSNPAVLQSADARVIVGDGASLSIILTPHRAVGISLVTVFVFDQSGANSSTSFQLTVNGQQPACISLLHLPLSHSRCFSLANHQLVRGHCHYAGPGCVPSVAVGCAWHCSAVRQLGVERSIRAAKQRDSAQRLDKLHTDTGCSWRCKRHAYCH